MKSYLLRQAVARFYSTGGNPIRWIKLIQKNRSEDFSQLLHIGGYLGEEFSSYLDLGIAEVRWVEPLPEFASILEQQFGTDKVYKFAVGSYCGYTIFHELNKSDSSSLYDHLSNSNISFQTNRDIVVRSIRLSCLLELGRPEFNPNIIVLDVQGAEGDILKSITSLDIADVKIMVVECSNPPIYANTQSYRQIRKQLKKMGFSSIRLFFEPRKFHGDVIFVRKNLKFNIFWIKFFAHHLLWQSQHLIYGLRERVRRIEK